MNRHEAADLSNWFEAEDEADAARRAIDGIFLLAGA